MSDKFGKISFSELLIWMCREYHNKKSVFGISAAKFFHESDGPLFKVLGAECSLPLGPAAGPHSQLAPNIVAAYLTGSRFIELKTVQKLDNLTLEKPCIDMRDEGYNCEWSTELSLEDAFDEYLKAWFLVHTARVLWGLSPYENGVIFNASVGYDLDGLKTPKMQTFIDNIINCANHPLYRRYKEELAAFAAGPVLEECGLAAARQELLGVVEKISPQIAGSMAVSTMHGCPANEIEAICRYLLTDKKVNLFLKLNPTLLGYETVRASLKANGYSYIELDAESFRHDLIFDDAVDMLRRLLQTAAEARVGFGVKLTNTLGARNTGYSVLPAKEVYVSGRALFPLSVAVAARLAAAFEGKLSISFSGGITLQNARDMLKAGVYPLTIASDLLKPGGYERLLQIAAECDHERTLTPSGPQSEQLTAVAEEALAGRRTAKQPYKKRDVMKVYGDLPLFNCYTAACKQACPVEQEPESYIELLQEGRTDEAALLILDRNPLAYTLSEVCDKKCELACTRLDYEGALNIRALKKYALEYGTPPEPPRLLERNGLSVAVIGATAGGLSAASFLGRAGFKVDVFEEEGGVSGILEKIYNGPLKPLLAKDMENIRANGVNLDFGKVWNAAGEQYYGYIIDARNENRPSGRENAAYFYAGRSADNALSVVSYAGEGRKIAFEIIKENRIDFPFFMPPQNRENIYRDARLKTGYLNFSRCLPPFSKENGMSEAGNCLQCGHRCEKCVEVCPNRANIVIEIAGRSNTGQQHQILHIDALCNECGDCSSFCPYTGHPYKDKFTYFSSRQSFEESENNGWLNEGNGYIVRLDKKFHRLGAAQIAGQDGVLAEIGSIIRAAEQQIPYCIPAE
jgi:putative selenate reductase